MVKIGWMFRSLLVSGVCTAAHAADEIVIPGYESESVTIAPPGASVGGFEVLDNGNYAIMYSEFGVGFTIGFSTIVEVAPDGTLIRTIYEPGKVFGSFLEQDPSDPDTLYFGESSRGNIMAIDLETGAASYLTQSAFPFDLAFAPDGTMALSWALDFDTSYVSLIDERGFFTEVVVSAQPSGGIEFDAEGNLYYTVPSGIFPTPPPNSSEVRRFSAQQLRVAQRTNKIWDTSDGELVGLVDGAYGVALDEEGDVFLTDSIFQQVVELDAKTGLEAVVMEGTDFGAYTYVRSTSGDHGVFERFQPQGGGTLHCLSTDFFSFNQVVRLHPRRATLSNSTGSVIPVGDYTLTIQDGAPLGVAVLYLAVGTASEMTVPNSTWNAPLFFELDLSQPFMWTQVFALDGNGELTLDLMNDGGAPGSVGLQAVIGAAAEGPLYGTTNALAVEFQ